MPRTDLIAALHTGDALHASWEAYLADVPMTWLTEPRHG